MTNDDRQEALPDSDIVGMSFGTLHRHEVDLYWEGANHERARTRKVIRAIEIEPNGTDWQAGYLAAMASVLAYLEGTSQEGGEAVTNV